MPNRVSRVKLQAVLEVEGVTFELSNVTLNFAVNSIPSATVCLAAGRNLSTLAAAPIHTTKVDFTKVLPARIRLSPHGQWSDGDKAIGAEGRWDDAGDQVIFEGYLAGTGYEQDYGQRRPAVYLTHWLSDLAFSSAISNQLQAGNMMRFRWRAIIGEQGAVATNRGAFIADHFGYDLFNSAPTDDGKGTKTNGISTDFWSNCLFKFFGRLSKQDALDTSIFEDACHGISKKNTSSQKALRRFETSRGKLVVGTNHLKGSASPFFKPLAMRIGEIESIIAASIGWYCAHQVLDSFGGTSLWDKLVADYSPAFAFIVVPRVQTAIVAPFVPGYRTTFDEEFGNGKILDARDYAQAGTTSILRRPLRGVGILQGGMSDQVGLFTRDAYEVIGGCYAPDPAAEGIVMFQGPPQWLMDAPAHAHGGVGSALAPVPASATTPRAPNLIKQGGKDDKTAVGAANASKDYYKAAARYFFNLEMLRGRSAVVSGKLRFDLAPGTTVRITNPGSLFISKDKLAESLVGSITTVSISMSADPSSAITSFQLDNIRTVRENENDRLSAEEHPFYKQAYSGAPLVDAYLFPE